MKFSNDMRTNVIKVSIGVIILTAVMLGVFAVIKKFDITVLWGALLGCGFTVFNFFMLSVSVKMSVDRSKNGAQGLMGVSYTVRLMLTAAMVILAIKLPVFNYIAAVIPLIFPRLVIMILNIGKRGK